MTMTKIFLLYPFKGFVSADKVAGWYSDAVANGEIADEYLHAHDTETMARALSDAGHITVGQWRDDSDLDIQTIENFSQATGE